MGSVVSRVGDRASTVDAPNANLRVNTTGKPKRTLTALWVKFIKITVRPHAQKEIKELLEKLA